MSDRIDEFGHVFAASATFNRPADTTQYAVGDLIANSTTAGSVIAMPLPVARLVSGGFIIRAGRLTKSAPSLTTPQFRAYLFTEAPVVSVGDNAAFNNAGLLATTKGPKLLGSMDFTMALAGSDGAVGFAAPSPALDLMYNFPEGVDSLYALLEARATYTPASGETFTLELTGLRT